MSETRDVVILGGGVIGLSIAYALAREGIACTVLDRRELGREASWAGAGLIPPPCEARSASVNPTVQLRSWSAELFPVWSAALREETGIDNGFRRTGGVDVARTEAEGDALRTTAGRWRLEGIVHERLAADDLHRVEPALNPEIRVAYFLPDRSQVRNPWHLRALSAAAARRGARLEPFQTVDRLETQGDRIVGVRAAGKSIPCDRVIMAAGAWSGLLLGDLGVHAPTPPLKGQIVLLRQEGARNSVRRIVEHGKNYLVPREDGRVLVGATEEDAGFDTRSTATGVRDLLNEAIWLCPALGRADVEASWAGLRPGSIDTRPYIGLAPGYRNLIVATGHKRAGLQLSPATAELVADLVLSRTPRMDLASFRVDRQPDPAADTFRS
jgi:glycine oxidase